MRQLHPTYDDNVDLVTAYAYPPDRQWVRANMVSSVDGCAAKDGSSRPLSGEGDQRVFAALRGLCDVVLVGAGTARTETYRGLRARESLRAQRESCDQRPAPVLALVSHRLDLDPSSDLFAGDERTIVITTGASDQDRRAQVSEVADVIVAGESELDVRQALHELEARQLARVLCEGGPSLLAAVAADGCLDELCLTIAPTLVGGPAPRVVDGPLVNRTVLTLSHLLEEDGFLFTRYAVG